MEEDGGSRTSSESPSHVSFTCPPPPPPASPPPPPPPPPPQEESGIQGEESGIQGEESESLPSESNSLVPLSDDLGEKIIRQVEYYFSDENLPTDKFLLKHVKKNKEGFVPIAVIMSFRKMKKLVQDDSLIVDALKKSSQLVVSPDGKRVKRLQPLVDTDIEDAKSRTVLVENLPEDYSENLQHLFGQIGNIKSICIRDPHSLQDSAKTCKAERAISAKLHALVEYDTAEAAQKAVGTLNDEKNWRSGMRVELLQKRMGKYGFAPKSWKGTVSEKSNNSHVAESTDGDENNSTAFDRHHDKTPEEEEEWSLGDKGGRRSRNRGRRGNRPHNGNHHGHGSVSATSATSATSCNDALSRPPPGPKMPDGTRGFTIGRGRPLSNQN